MRKFSLKQLGLASLSLFLLPTVSAAVPPEQWLLEQIRLGEASHRDDLVQQSLYRLELITPDNPEVIAARMRLALRQGDQQQAQQQLARLAKLGSTSPVYLRAKSDMILASPEGSQQLQQARLLATAGRIPEAIAAYRKLFGGDVPSSPNSAAEYWRLMARQPEQRGLAIAQLQALNQQNPGNADVRNALANLLFDDGQTQAGYLVVQQMAQDEASRSDAATIWLAQINKMPVSDQSVAQLQRFLLEFNDGDYVVQAQQKLALQQKLLADPTFQARLHGVAPVDNNQNAPATAAQHQTLAQNANDSEALGRLGQAYARQGNRAEAISLFKQAQKMDSTGDNSSKWRSLIKTNRYWLLIKQGDDALQAKQLAQAEQFYRQAQNIDSMDSYAPLGLGDVAVARHDDVAAERFYQQALRLDAKNDSAVRGLVGIYQRRSPEQALAYLHQLSRDQQNTMRDTQQSLQADVLQRQAEALKQQQQWIQAENKLRQALAFTPDDIWLTYRLAMDLRQVGRQAEGDILFRTLAQKHPDDAQQVYAYALYLSASDRTGAALTRLNALPRAQWDDKIRALVQRLQLDDVLQRANDLHNTGHEREAIACLLTTTASKYTYRSDTGRLGNGTRRI